MRDSTEIRARLFGALRVAFAHGALLVMLVSPAAARDGVADASPDVQVAPMTKLLQRVHDTFPGRILKVDLEESERTDERPATYEVKVLTSGGNVLKLFYDARTLRLERILGRYRSDGERRSAMTGDDSGVSSDDGAGHDTGDDSDGSDGGSGGESDGGSDGGASDD